MRPLAILTGLFLLGVSSTASAEAPLAPVDFLGYTILGDVKVSPDGRSVAFTTRRDDFEADRTERTVWWLPLDENGRAGTPVAVARGAGGLRLAWSPDSRLLSYLSLEDGPPRLSLFDTTDGSVRTVAEPTVSVYAWLPDGRGVIAAARERRPEKSPGPGRILRPDGAPSRSSFWRIPVEDDAPGEPSRLATVDHSVIGLAVSPDGARIAWVSGLPGRAPFFDSLSPIEVHVLPTSGGPSRQVTRNFVAESQLAWGPDGQLYAAGFGDPRSTEDVRTQARLFRIDAGSGAVETLVPGFEGELGAPLGIMPFALVGDGTLLATGNVSTRTQLFSIDLGSRTATPVSRFPGDVANLSASADGSVVAFTLVTRSRFPELYLADGVAGVASARPVTDFNGDLSVSALPEIETIDWRNGDGDVVEGVLYWPPGRRGARGLPLVVDIHGGPWIARTEGIVFNLPNDYKYYPALLASQGYLVLEPNYRGSSGRGDAWLHAVEGRPLSAPVSDVLAGVDELVARGWADPERMGVMGYSYGGTVTGGLIGRTDRFKVACAGAGIFNESSYFGASDGFYPSHIRHRRQAPWEAPEHFWRESAISGAGRIQTPTLVIHGEKDRAVPLSQSQELYRALVWRGIPAELRVFPGEGHSFARPSNKLAKVQVEMAWLDRHLVSSPAQ